MLLKAALHQWWTGRELCIKTSASLTFGCLRAPSALSPRMEVSPRASVVSAFTKYPSLAALPSGSHSPSLSGVSWDHLPPKKTACTQFSVSVSAPGGTQAQTVPSRARTGVQQVRGQNVRKQCRPAFGGPWEQCLLKFSLLVPCSLAPVLTLLNRSPSLHLPLTSVCFFTLGLILSFCRETFHLHQLLRKMVTNSCRPVFLQNIINESLSPLIPWKDYEWLGLGNTATPWTKHQSSWIWPKWLAQPGRMPISEGEWGTIIIDSPHGVGEVFSKGKRCYRDEKGDQKTCWTVKNNSYYSPLWFSIPFPFYRWVKLSFRVANSLSQVATTSTYQSQSASQI